MRSITPIVAGILLLSISLLAQSNPVPFVNQPLVPTTVAPGSPAFTLTVNGTGFVSASTLNWNGASLSTTFISSTQLTANVPAADLVTAGTASVTVVNPTPGGGVSNVAFLQITAPAPAVGFLRSDLALASTSQSINVVTADFNHDGKLDIATIGENEPGTVSVFLGNGDGTFQPAVSYATGQEPSSVAAGDFNGDGKIDLVVTNFRDSTVSILLGNGDGTFQPHVDYATGVYPTFVMCGDFNGDGKLDVVVTNFYGTFGPPYNTSISILLGNGDGTLQPHVDYIDLLTNPYALNIGDFNGDGKLDVVMATDGYATNGAAVYLGNGDGTFQPPVGYETASSSFSVEVADFNGDGKPDLAMGTDAGVSILLGNGDGTFQPHVDYDTAVRVFGVTSGDFNGDGKLDLALTNLDTKQVSILLGNGDGTFQSPINFGTLVAPFSVTKGDFNGDGSLDLLVGYEASGSTSVLLRSPVFLSPASLSFAAQTINTTSASQSVTLTNTGSAALTILSVMASGKFAQTNTCGSSVSVGASCTIVVTFTPTRQGTQTGTITITDSAQPGTQTISLSGAGTVVSLSRSSLKFPPERVGVTSPSISTTLTNVGATTMSFFGTSISGAAHRDFAQTNDCGFTIAAGKSCTIKVTFTPSTKGARIASLNLFDNGGGSPQMVPLSGTGQ
jgi:hypothetical protein